MLFRSDGCEENICDHYEFGVGVVPALSEDDCFQDILLTTHVDNSCNVKCDVGYEAQTATITCAHDALHKDPTEGQPTCIENLCAAYVFGVGVEGGHNSNDACYDGIRLQSRTVNACLVQCEAGYGKAIAQINCAADAADGDATSGEITCIENQCTAYDYGYGVVNADSDSCTDGKALKTRTDNSCSVKCDQGFEEQEARIVCANDERPDGYTTGAPTCVENSCETYTYTHGIVRAGSSNDCVDPDTTLFTHKHPTCNIKCDVGFQARAGTVKCAINANYGDATTGQFECVENKCAPFVFGPGVQGGGAVACTNHVELQTRTAAKCGVECGPGYVANEAEISCSHDAAQGQTANGWLVCEENFCATYTFGVGVEGDTSTTGTACNGSHDLNTHTHAACDVRCQAGYAPASSTVVCAHDAHMGQVTTGEPECRENTCEAYEFGVGVQATSGEDACYSGIVLQTRTDFSCDVKCEAGYASQQGTIMCDHHAVQGTPTEGEPVCVENSCDPYIYGLGVVAGVPIVPLLRRLAVHVHLERGEVHHVVVRVEGHGAQAVVAHVLVELHGHQALAQGQLGGTVPAVPRHEAEVGVAHGVAHVGDALVGQLLARAALAVGVEASPLAAVRKLRLRHRAVRLLPRAKHGALEAATLQVRRLRQPGEVHQCRVDVHQLHKGM